MRATKTLRILVIDEDPRKRDEMVDEQCARLRRCTPEKLLFNILHTENVEGAEKMTNDEPADVVIFSKRMNPADKKRAAKLVKKDVPAPIC